MGIIDLDKTIETTTFKGTLENMEDRIIEESIEVIGAMNMIEAEIGQEKGHFQEILVTLEIEVPVTVDQDQDLKLVPTEYRIRCYNCREYDHFVRDCPNSREERDLEQLQLMLDLEAEEQTHLLTSRQDSPTQDYRSHLNL